MIIFSLGGYYMRVIKAVSWLISIFFTASIYADVGFSNYHYTFKPLCDSSNPCRIEITNMSDKQISFYSPKQIAGVTITGTVDPGQVVQKNIYWTDVSWDKCSSWDTPEGPLAVYYGDSAWQVSLKTGCGRSEESGSSTDKYVDYWIGFVKPDLQGQCIKGSCSGHTFTGTTSQGSFNRNDSSGNTYYKVISYTFK
jgi:hypothetical protein